MWRIKHPEKKQYTWHSNQSPFVHCRLDYFLVSENILNILKSCVIKPGFKTDHSMVSLTLDNQQGEKGPGYFKLNNSILLDAEYQTKIKQSITEIITFNNTANPNTKWELIKGAIRNESIKYSSFKKKLNLKNQTT